MSTLEKVGNTRVRKPNNNPPLPVEEVPGGLMAYIKTPEHDLCDKAVASAIKDEIKSAKKKIIKIKVKKQGYLQTFTDILKCPPGSAHYAMFEELDQLEEQEEWGKLSSQQTIALWCTLSPEPDTCTVDDLMETMQKIAKKQGVALMTWVIEKYGKEREHIHAHFLILLDKTTQSGERSRMKATVTRICKDYKTKTEKYLQIKSCSEKNYKSKLAYVKGQKTDVTKQPLVDKDRQWREEIGLQPWYIYPPIDQHDQD